MDDPAEGECEFAAGWRDVLDSTPAPTTQRFRWCAMDEKTYQLLAHAREPVPPTQARPQERTEYVRPRDGRSFDVGPAAGRTPPRHRPPRSEPAIEWRTR